MKKNFLLSLVIPAYNEEKNIPELLKRLFPILKKYSWEMIFVDDGSTDKTAQIIKDFAKKDKRIKLISFQRNFGHQMALTCGYKYAKGDCVITMDADLQDPPEVIEKMIEKWQEGYDVVYGQRLDRQTDSFFKKTTADIFYKIINLLSDVPIPQHVADFRLVDRKVVKFLNSLPEKARFLRGLVAWPGFKSTIVRYKRERRFSGKTHYSLSKMINFALDGIMSFSTKPLRMAIYFGFFVAFLGAMGIIYAVVGKFLFPEHWVTGWTALFVGIMFLGGVQLITIGIIGEYVGKIYEQIKARPFYVIKEKVNIEE